MKELIGFNLISFAITLFIVSLSEFEIKEKIVMLIMEIVIIAILSIGIFLMVGT